MNEIIKLFKDSHKMTGINSKIVQQDVEELKRILTKME